MQAKEIETQLHILHQTIAPELEVIVDKNIQPYRKIWKLWNHNEQVGQIESRFGSPYSDEPDGFSAYLVGHNWTDVLPTVDEVVKQLEEKRWVEE